MDLFIKIQTFLQKIFTPTYNVIELDKKIALMDAEDEANEMREIEWGFNTNPKLAQKIVKLQILAEAQGFPIKVNQAYRSETTQNALYAKGRTRPGTKVTNAKGGQSWHNFGCAVDVCFENGDPYGESQPWGIIGALGESQGLEWGGRWKSFKDRPHFQLTNGMKLSEARKLLAKGGLKAVWEKISS